MHPVYIGITTSLNDGEQRLDHAYVSAIEQCGGVPVLAPMLASRQLTGQFADLLHGLVVTGGPAIVEGLIGTLPDDIKETDELRIRSDTWLVDEFLTRRQPIFGICYGMQLINSVFGGSIYSDVEKQLPGSLTHSKSRGATNHPVEIIQGSRLSHITNEPVIVTNTRHIQALADVGDGLAVNARSTDGVIEGIESSDGLLLGVQFHPEQMGQIGLPLFADLVERARQAAYGPV